MTPVPAPAPVPRSNLTDVLNTFRTPAERLKYLAVLQHIVGNLLLRVTPTDTKAN